MRVHLGYLFFREADAFAGVVAGARNAVDLAELVRRRFDGAGCLLVAALESGPADGVRRHAGRAAGFPE
ncbi:hypothetical protein A5642_27065 [Mycolicibacterium mucogenicum]|uniref:Uncharacterized protein n=1 Tax=Mycolicibacterium mucogenicum TaxID=56689 RepID=A0A1A0MD40_MYCMU|nr:hypothetical protein A5642_27065 [Mycolicibacterium mucogenicum]